MDERIVRWFKKEYPQGVVIKLGMVGAHGTAGWPDRLFLANGGSAFIEMKATGKVPTDLQRRRMEELWAAGQQAACFNEVEPAIEWLEAVLRGDRP